MNLQSVIIILFAHYVADFIMQSDKEASEKSKSNYYLTMHAAKYALVIMLSGWLLFQSTTQVLTWALFNGAIHWIQDYFTSRLNAKLWRENKRHWFFVAIGADQFVHYCFLLSSYNYLS